MPTLMIREEKKFEFERDDGNFPGLKFENLNLRELLLNSLDLKT
jgi:hypothetical protein